MRALPVFIVSWALGGFGAVVGSVLGNAAGRAGLFGGAIAGGMLGVWIAVMVATKLRWLPLEDRRGGTLGGIVGFAIAAPIAVMNLHTPVTPVLVCGLAGVGVLLGAGMARGWRQG